jgi:hypothetical protein
MTGIQSRTEAESSLGQKMPEQNFMAYIRTFSLNNLFSPLFISFFFFARSTGGRDSLPRLLGLIIGIRSRLLIKLSMTEES